MVPKLFSSAQPALASRKCEGAEPWFLSQIRLSTKCLSIKDGKKLCPFKSQLRYTKLLKLHSLLFMD